MRQDDPPRTGPSRRSVLTLAGTATAAAAGATALPDEAQALAARPDQRAQRYQESDHIRKYYWTNRR
jgi:arginine/ornithine N-succinyltransferase beta subunit